MTISLNSAGAAHAASLIAAGKVNRSGSWSFDAADGDALLGSGGDNWAAYADAHLGVNDAEADNTKARWEYPFSKGGEVYRSAIVAIRDRAGQQKDEAIFAKAGTLLEKIDGADEKKSADVLVERRAQEGAKATAASPSDRKLGGYAILYNSPTLIGDPADPWSFTEIIAPGAADAAINGDVRALVDHDPGRVIGRTKSGTLRLVSDKTGVSVEIDVPNTTDGNDLYTLVERGDISGMSFGFVVTKQTWDETVTPAVRTIEQINLMEVSAVAFPAYADTEIGLRARSEWRAKHAPPRAEPIPAPPVSRANANAKARLKLSLDIKARTTR